MPGLEFDPIWIERILLHISKLGNICIEYTFEGNSGTFAIVGGILGGLAGMAVGGVRLGASVGAGLGTAAGYFADNMVELRKVWDKIKEKLEGIFEFIYDLLRELDAEDYATILVFLLDNNAALEEIVIKISYFIARKLQKTVKTKYSTDVVPYRVQ